MNAIHSAFIVSIENRRKEARRIIDESLSGASFLAFGAAHDALDVLDKAEGYVTLDWLRALELEADASALLARARMVG